MAVFQARRLPGFARRKAKLGLGFLLATRRAKCGAQIIVALGIGRIGVDVPAQFANSLGLMLGLKQTNAEELVERGKIGQGGDGIPIAGTASRARQDFEPCTLQRQIDAMFARLPGRTGLKVG